MVDRRLGGCDCGKAIGAEAPTPAEIDAPYCEDYLPMELDFSPDLGEVYEGLDAYEGFSLDE